MSIFLEIKSEIRWILKRRLAFTLAILPSVFFHARFLVHAETLLEFLFGLFVLVVGPIWQVAMFGFCALSLVTFVLPNYGKAFLHPHLYFYSESKPRWFHQI